MEDNAGEWMSRREEVKRQLSTDRRSFRALVEARCEQDSRRLGATYHVGGYVWLWYCGERLTPEEAQRETLANAAAEFESLIEGGFPQQEAWEKTLGTVEGKTFCSPARSNYNSQGVASLGSPELTVTYYQQSSLADISRVGRALKGQLSSCPKCRLTYLIEYSAMRYASGKSIANRSRTAIIVTPGRVMPSSADAQLATASHYGINYSWQATPWRLL